MVQQACFDISGFRDRGFGFSSHNHNILHLHARATGDKFNRGYISGIIYIGSARTINGKLKLDRMCAAVEEDETLGNCTSAASLAQYYNIVL